MPSPVFQKRFQKEDDMNFGRGRRRIEVEVAKGTDNKELIWKLPHIKLKGTGKIGPAFGLGAGCGVGFGMGIGPVIQLGFGLGAGCGVGLGFGYGFGQGIAHDEHRMYSNVGKLPSENAITVFIRDFVINTKKLAGTTLKEIDKWKR